MTTNTDTPFGLKPIKHKGGAPYNGAFNPYLIPASDSQAMFIGDVVLKTTTANAARVQAPEAGTFEIGTLPQCIRATVGTTERITGVIVGFAPDPDGLGRTHRLASTERIAYVCDDPDMMFEVQGEGTVAATDMGLNAVLIYTHAGSAVTGRSGAEFDCGTTTAMATTVGFQLCLHRLANRPDNFIGANAKVLVTINTHTEVNASTGI